MVDYRPGSGDYTGGFEGVGGDGYRGYPGYSGGGGYPAGGGYSGIGDVNSEAEPISDSTGGSSPDAAGSVEDAAGGLVSDASTAANSEAEKIVLNKEALGLLGRVNMCPSGEYVDRLLGSGCRDYEGVVKMFIHEQLFNKICPEWADTDTYPSVFADFITKDEWYDPLQSKIYDQYATELEQIHETRERAISSSASAVMKALTITNSVFLNYSHNILWCLLGRANRLTFELYKMKKSLESIAEILRDWRKSFIQDVFRIITDLKLLQTTAPMQVEPTYRAFREEMKTKSASLKESITLAYNNLDTLEPFKHEIEKESGNNSFILPQEEYIPLLPVIHEGFTTSNIPDTPTTGIDALGIKYLNTLQQAIGDNQKEGIEYTDELEATLAQFRQLYESITEDITRKFQNIDGTINPTTGQIIDDQGHILGYYDKDSNKISKTPPKKAIDDTDDNSNSGNNSNSNDDPGKDICNANPDREWKNGGCIDKPGHHNNNPNDPFNNDPNDPFNHNPDNSLTPPNLIHPKKLPLAPLWGIENTPTIEHVNNHIGNDYEGFASVLDELAKDTAHGNPALMYSITPAGNDNFDVRIGNIGNTFTPLRVTREDLDTLANNLQVDLTSQSTRALWPYVMQAAYLKHLTNNLPLTEDNIRQVRDMLAGGGKSFSQIWGDLGATNIQTYTPTGDINSQIEHIHQLLTNNTNPLFIQTGHYSDYGNSFYSQGQLIHGNGGYQITNITDNGLVTIVDPFNSDQIKEITLPLTDLQTHGYTLTTGQPPHNP